MALAGVAVFFSRRQAWAKDVLTILLPALLFSTLALIFPSPIYLFIGFTSLTALVALFFFLSLLRN